MVNKHKKKPAKAGFFLCLFFLFLPAISIGFVHEIFRWATFATFYQNEINERV